VALQVAQHFNGSNLRDTGHSSKRSRMAGLARITVIAKSQGAVFDFNCSEQGGSQSYSQRNVGCRFSLSFELFALSFELFDRGNGCRSMLSMAWYVWDEHQPDAFGGEWMRFFRLHD